MGSIYFTKKNRSDIKLLDTSVTVLSDLAAITETEEAEFERALGHKPENIWVFVHGTEYQLK